MRDAIAVMALAMFALSNLPAHAEDGPFEKFFKRMRHAFRDTKGEARDHRPPPRRAADKVEDAGERGVHSPPSESNTRSTQRASTSKSGKRDLPYATPVPGKKGFVTSPFAPNSGYIDVRDFPPGTEVKDPYTGKTFRTP